ncbi:site-specific integrase [Kitasatospora sp. NA04385]|uniref:site-specific integrase n=1 Tax=Kitasatospora sp. NA04385 TaxID=2742135 RepID=UPI0015909E46|nr:site-specific integrase [Kitasatospora sp. NA04385]QKW20281.1 site-specific integrase [Kitasatospora sp. NA04385]
MKNGTVSRRCACRNPDTGKPYGAQCPKAPSSRHGIWYVTQELVPRQDNSRRHFHRGGFTTAADAKEELSKVIALMAIPEKDDPTGQLAISDLLEACAAAKEPLPDYDETLRRFKTGQVLNSKMTVAEWLDRWLAGRKRLRVTGLKRYECDARVHLKPHIKATGRAALNVAIAQQVMSPFNPFEHVELLPGTKPKALIWTEDRIARWQETGVKPSPVMVWTPEPTATFLDFVAHDRLYMLWRIIAFRGTRRGEACGVRWEDYSAAQRSLAIATQLVQDGWEVLEGAPKTSSGVRLLSLDKGTFDGLEDHKIRQENEHAAWGDAWQNTGRIFTNEDGSILHPGKVSDLFDRIVEAAGLPPIRLHDLRHGAATIMLFGKIDPKIVAETLGHSDTRITRDVYQSVLDDLNREAAEKVAELVPHTRRPLAAVPDGTTPQAAVPQMRPLTRPTKTPSEAKTA